MFTEKIVFSPLQYLFYAILFIYPFLPVTLGPAFGIGSETAMTMILFPLGFLCFAVWIYRYKTSGFMVWIAGGLVLYLATMAIFQNPNGSTFMELSRLIVLFGIIFYLTKCEIDALVVSKIITVSAIIACMVTLFLIEPFGLWTHIQGQGGIRGVIGTDNLMAAYLLVCLPFAFITMDKNKIIGAVALFLIIPCLMFTMSRAGIILLGLELIACLVIYVKETGKWKLALAIKLFAIAVITIFMVKEGFEYSVVTPFGRVEFAEYTKKMFYTHPVVGVGAGQWGKEAHRMGLTGAWYHPHSEFAISLAEYGIIGLLLVLLFYGINIVLAFKYYPLLCVGLCGMITHSFIAGVRAPVQVFYLAVMIGLVGQKERNKYEKTAG